jgi:hypothetical protein
MKTFREFCLEAYKLPGVRIGFKTFYHGTSSNNAENIRRTGFNSNTGDPKHYHMPPDKKPYWAPNRVYVTSDKANADRYASVAFNKRTPTQQIVDFFRGKNKPNSETIKLAISNRSDIRPNTNPGRETEFTVPRRTGDIGIKNAEALTRMRQGTIRRSGGSSTLSNVGRGVQQRPSGMDFTPGTGGNFGISGIGLAN